jgi:lysophospholipase L1-like esterase
MRPTDGEITDGERSLRRLAGQRSGPSRRFLIGAAGASLVAPVIRPRRGGHDPAAERHMNIALLDDRVLATPRPLAQTAAQQSQALTPLFAGLAGRLTARCNIVCIGDSITEGQGAEGPPSSGFENRWLARLRDQLRSRFPTQGLTGGGRGFIGVAGTGELSFAWPATTSQSLGTGTAGPKAKFLQLAAAGQSITFNLVGDSADIMWMQVAYGGTFSWAVDGGPATKVSTNGSSTVDGKLTHIALGAPGSHTLVLSWVSGRSNIDGVIEYDGDYSSGIQTHDAGHYGYQTSSWVSALNGGAAGSSAAAIAALAPAAVIITLGVNDQYSGVAPATYQSNLQTIISDLKARLPSPYPTFLLNMLPPRYDQASFTYPWSQYITAAQNVASADTSGPGGTSVVAVFDFAGTPYMPGADTDVYGFWQANDLVHPSDKGHQRIGDCLIEFLTVN